MAAEIEEMEAPGPSNPDGATPTQRKNTVEENRRLRRDYRNFAKRAEEDADRLMDLRTGELAEKISDLNALHTRVQEAREQAEDTACFYLLCMRGAEAAKRVIGPGKNRTAEAFLRALKAAHVSTGNAQEHGEILPEAFNWAALGRAAAPHFKRAPGLCCMLGPMSAAPKVRKQAVRQPRKVLQALEAPAEVAATQERKKEPAIKNMEDMHAALLARPGHAANVLACVVNHASFGQSVENAFALSFLVKSNKVVLSKDPAGGFQVRALTEDEEEAMGRGAPPRSQAIFGFDMAAWAAWKQRVRPADTLMPHRPPYQLPGSCAAAVAPAAAAAAAAGPSGAGAAQKAKKRKPARQEVDDEEEEEEEEDEAAAAARARKGKRKVTS